MDFHVAKTLLFRGWSIIAGGTTAVLIPFFLSPEEQGYYFTFAAVVAAHVFFELGLNQVLIQLAGHTAAYLHGPGADFQSKTRWSAAVVSLLRLSTRWNAVVAALFFLMVGLGGAIFFSNQGSISPTDWLAPWVLLTLAAALNLALSGRLAICEGLGEVGQVAQLRLKQSLLGYISLWCLLMSGAGLWAATAIPLASAICTFVWLRRHALQKKLMAERRNWDSAGHGAYSWRRDVFPMQWRIALSWASGYFIFNFMTPVIFSYQGAESAGRLGLALQIFSAIAVVGMSWISAKVPVFAALIACGNRRELNNLFDRQILLSVAATCACALAFMLLAWSLRMADVAAASRLPSLAVMAILGVATVTNTAIYAMAAYMRAHKEEPLLPHSIVCAVLIGAGVFLAAHWSLFAVVSTYAGVSAVVALPWCYRIFLRYRARSA